LQNTGEFESIEPGAENTYVSFQDRKTAEKFYFGLQGKGLPGVDANLELSWVQGAPPPPAPASVLATTTAPTVFSAGNATAVDAVPQTVVGEAQEGAADSSAGVDAASKDVERRVVDMDYEMPDEEAW
jgi:hypothetical protein